MGIYIKESNDSNGYTYKVVSTNLKFGNVFDTIVSYPDNYGMRLASWSRDVVIRVQMPDENSKMTAPYLYVESRYGRVPWKETMIEMFSDKWELVQFEKEKKGINIEKVNKIVKEAVKDPSYPELVNTYHNLIDTNNKNNKDDKDNKKPKCNHDCSNCKSCSGKEKNEITAKDFLKVIETHAKARAAIIEHLLQD